MRFSPRPDCQIPKLAELYEQYLPDTGTFVEVGAFDGVAYSNTVFLAEAGWTGLYVEAHPDFAKVCADNHAQHPNVSIVTAAVSCSEGRAKLYLAGSCSSLILDKSARDWGAREDNALEVEVTTLDRLLDKSVIKPEFELLVVDVENAELDVLAGFSVGKWRPRMAIVETHEMDNAVERNFKALPVTQYFTHWGYRKIFSDQINSVFVR